jgi:hypothetical protein
MPLRLLAVFLILASAILIAPGLGQAQGRPDTRTMTCGEANALVRRAGAVVMTTGQHTFRRFVAHRSYCDPWELVRPVYAPTRDNPRCVITGVCEEPLFRLDPWGRW